MQTNHYDIKEANVDKCFVSLDSQSNQQETTPNKRAIYAHNAGQLVTAIVSNEMEVCISDILKSSRGRANICVARQVVMYLMHTSMGCSYYEVSDFLSRDRTTVSHGCRLIEDMRDDSTFDLMLSNMEAFTQSAMNVALTFSAVDLPDVR